MKNDIKDMVLSTVDGFYKAGTVNDVTLREIKALCLSKPKAFSPRTIVKIRRKFRLSQAAFAQFLNTSVSTIQKWEQGQKKPSGSALKLLSIVNEKGITALL